jgi:hypothetical protein
MANLADVAVTIATRAAAEYLRVHCLKADPEALAECLKSWCKIQLPRALADAKDALDARMPQVAEATFAASMVQAGIEAAKEAGFPIGMLAGA